MSVIALALASLAAVVPAAAFSSSHSVSGVCVSAGTRTTPTTSALYQYAPQAAGLVDVSDIYAPRDVYSMEEWAAQYGMQKVSSQLSVLLGPVRSDRDYGQRRERVATYHRRLRVRVEQHFSDSCSLKIKVAPKTSARNTSWAF